MATFILRAIDPALWAKVQAKAVAEGLTPKQLVLKAIAQYVALLVVILLSTACAYHSPTGPTPVVVVPSTAAASIRLVGASRPDGKLDVVATVLTASGGFVAAVPVTFSTSAGTFSVDTVTTNDVGTARTILTTTANPIVRAQAAGLDTSVTMTGAPATVLPDPPPTPTPTPFPTPGPAPLTVTIYAPPTGLVNTPIVFTAAGPAADTVAWTFGDGGTSAIHGSPSHTYTTTGTFTVGVTVTRAGQTAAATTTITITLPPDAPGSTPAAPALLLTLSCTAAPHLSPTSCNITARDETGAIVTSALTSAAWDFGDGTTPVTTMPLAQHTYTQAGSYVIGVTAVGPGGRKGSASATVTIS